MPAASCPIFTTGLRVLAAGVLLLGCTGCAYKVVRPAPLLAANPSNGGEQNVTYPAYIVVHDSESPWDVHQIKSNLVGFTEYEVVYVIDLGLDGITPGRRRRPIESGVEWIKNAYAHMPDLAPVRIVGGFFSALGLEKITILSALANPMFALTRVVYITDWVQDTLGEVNAAAGYLVPWKGPFIPRAATAPVNRTVDWTQSGVITGYIYVIHKVNIGVDAAIDTGENTYGGFIGLFVR